MRWVVIAGKAKISSPKAGAENPRPILIYLGAESWWVFRYATISGQVRLRCPRRNSHRQYGLVEPARIMQLDHPDPFKEWSGGC